MDGVRRLKVIGKGSFARRNYVLDRNVVSDQFHVTRPASVVLDGELDAFIRAALLSQITGKET